MMSKKVYARQVPPEYQTSPLFYDNEFWPDGVIVTGNRQYNSHKTPAFEAVTANIDNLADDTEDIKNNRQGWYKSITEYLNDVFPPEHKKGYTTKDVASWKKIAAEYPNTKNREENALICRALHLITGKQYHFAIIRGCCQSDWNICYYPAEFDSNFVSHFETEYFNTGTEWIIHDEENTPKCPEDISGHSMYCYTHDPAEEIANETGTAPKNVVLYGFEGYNQIARYALVEG